MEIAMVVDSLGGVDIGGLVPGAHVVVVTSDPTGAVEGRRLGMEVRDTVLVLEREGMRFAFLLRKPLEGTLVNTVLKYGAGGLWVDGCRYPKAGGRWPSNLVLVHGAGCKRIGTRVEQAPYINRFTDGMKPWGEGAGSPYERTGGGEEEVAVYDCEQLCPVGSLNRQEEGSGRFFPQFESEVAMRAWLLRLVAGESA